MSYPKVSILLPTFSRYTDGLLAKAVESALCQTWPELELIVVDDGSTDGSAEYLAGMAQRDARVTHVRLERNIGLPALALAKAYEHASGDYIAWLFDDCELMPNHLQTLVRALLENPDWAMAYGAVNAELGDGAFTRIGSPPDVEALSQCNNDIPNVGVVMPRSTIDRFGWYDPHIILKRLCDWDLWWRIAREAPIGFVDEVVAIEHGLRLTESLGRSNFVDASLSLRYASTDRNHRLAPASLSFEDAYRRTILPDATAAERLALEYLVFEHALATLDTPRVQESLQYLGELNGNNALARRFAIQHGSQPSTPFESLLVAASGHVKRRTATDVASLIGFEQVAAKRLDIIRIQEREIESHREFGMTQLSVAKAAQDELARAYDRIGELHAMVRDEHALADDRLAIADERMALLLHAQEQVMEAHRIADERLVAADERLTIAEERLVLLREAQQLAEERLAIIQRLEQGGQ